MVIRTIHHQAATGGTLISKCIAALSDVYLLSEINPLDSATLRFAPTEPLLQLDAQYKINIEHIKRRHFINQIELILELCRSRHKTVVLRDHNHPAFMWQRVQNRRPLLEFLDDYKTLSLVTIRDPIDSFVSCLKNGWLKHIGNDFEVYCQRHLLFMQKYDAFEYVKYEDFCAQPANIMKKICGILMLNYEEDFINKFSNIILTGDSGRKRSEIVVHPRRELSDEILKQVEVSTSYKLFCNTYGY